MQIDAFVTMVERHFLRAVTSNADRLLIPFTRPGERALRIRADDLAGEAVDAIWARGVNHYIDVIALSHSKVAAYPGARFDQAIKRSSAWPTPWFRVR